MPPMGEVKCFFPLKTQTNIGPTFWFDENIATLENYC